MNKKIIIGIIAVVLIVTLAIIVGMNLGEKSTEPANTNPTSNTTSTPNGESIAPTPETSTPILEETTSPEPTQTKDISGMTSEQRKDYAKSIAKSIWEKSGEQIQVFYSYDGMENEEIYNIAVREEATTNTLVIYKINIKTGSYEITY